MSALLLLTSVFATFMANAQVEDQANNTAPPPPKEKMVPRLGHNVSATTYVLNRGQCTLGIQAAACGLSRRWTVGTVPWLYANYNMASVVNRIRLKTFPEGGSWSAQLSYFKTYTQQRSGKYITYPYDMEAYFLQFIRSYQLNSHYRLHTGFHSNYYANDKRPFSLRRPIANRNAGQFGISSLHEVALYKRWFMLGELGLLEILQPAPPDFHGGISFGRSGYSYEWHLGFSLTSTILGLFNPRARRDYQQELRDTESGFHQHLDREKTKRDYAIHPEFSLQYFF